MEWNSIGKATAESKKSERRGRALCFLLVLAMSLVATGAARAQVAGATLSGLITDSSGKAVPGASVAIRNTGTGELRPLAADDQGYYSAPNLNPGSYEVTVTSPGFATLIQKEVVLNVGASEKLDLSIKVGGTSETVVVSTAPPSVQLTTSQISSTVDSRTVRELPLNGRDWTSLATLEPGVVNIPNQATTGFSANKGNRGFGNQLSDSGHRPNENVYRVNGMVINDYSNAAPGGPTGLNLGVDAIQEFSVITTGYTAEYGRTSGAVINAITRSGTNQLHGNGYFFDRDSIFDARNYFDGPKIAPFRRIQFGGSAGGPIIPNRLFVFGDYEGVRQSQSTSGTIRVPDAVSRAAAVAAVQPYLALWPTAPAGAPDVNGVQTFNVNTPTVANENYYIVRGDYKASDKDSLDGTYFFDSGPQTQGDPLGNVLHKVYSRRWLASGEETHVFGNGLVNAAHGGLSRILGDINTPVSGDSAATDSKLAIAPGSVAPPQIPVAGLTTAYGLGGFNRFNHAYSSAQAYDDVFLTRGKHSITTGFSFERVRYNVLEKLSPNGRMNTYSLAGFLSNAPDKLNAVAPGQSHEVPLRESIIAGYVQDDWRATSNFTINMGVRYEFATRPSGNKNIPGYTVNGYTVASAPFQQIITLTNCLSSPTACGPVGTSSPIASNPTTKNVQPRIGMEWDPFHTGKTALRAGGGLFDVLPLPYEFGLNTAATAPFQIIGSAPGATLGTGTNPNVNFNEQKVRNRYIEQHPKRALVANWNVNVEQQITPSWSMFVGYVGSRTVHLSAAADDINLVQPQSVAGVGVVFPCDPSQLGPGQDCNANQTGTRIDPNWGGGAGIRPVLFDGAASYSALQAQAKRAASHGVQGQLSYTWGKCRDLSSSPVTGDTYLNSLAVPLMFVKSARVGACDFDVRQTITATVLWDLPNVKADSGLVRTVLNGWELGTIVSRTTGAPFTVTAGDGNDPLGTGFNGDYSMDPASIKPNCNPIHGGFNYLNAACFTPPTAPTSLAVATTANPYGCAPNSFTAYTGTYAAGQQPCSNVLGNTRRNQFYGPGLANVDFSLFKNTNVPKISESFRAQFRAEFFNVLNHTNFLSPGFLNTFGQNNSVYDFDGSPLTTALNQTSTTSRQIQLGVKLIF